MSLPSIENRSGGHYVDKVALLKFDHFDVLDLTIDRFLKVNFIDTNAVSLKDFFKVFQAHITTKGISHLFLTLQSAAPAASPTRR